MNWQKSINGCKAIPIEYWFCETTTKTVWRESLKTLLSYHGLFLSVDHGFVGDSCISWTCLWCILYKDVCVVAGFAIFVFGPWSSYREPWKRGVEKSSSIAYLLQTGFISSRRILISRPFGPWPMKTWSRNIIFDRLIIADRIANKYWSLGTRWFSYGHKPSLRSVEEEIITIFQITTYQLVS
jgi:hypothetical protein